MNAARRAVTLLAALAALALAACGSARTTAPPPTPRPPSPSPTAVPTLGIPRVGDCLAYGIEVRVVPCGVHAQYRITSIERRAADCETSSVLQYSGALGAGFYCVVSGRVPASGAASS